MTFLVKCRLAVFCEITTFGVSPPWISWVGWSMKYVSLSTPKTRVGKLKGSRPILYCYFYKIYDGQWSPKLFPRWKPFQFIYPNVALSVLSLTLCFRIGRRSKINQLTAHDLDFNNSIRIDEAGCQWAIGSKLLVFDHEPFSGGFIFYHVWGGGQREFEVGTKPPNLLI